MKRCSLCGAENTSNMPICAFCNAFNCRRYYQENREKENHRRLQWWRQHKEQENLKRRGQWKRYYNYEKKERQFCKICGEPSNFTPKCRKCWQQEYRTKNRVKLNNYQREHIRELPDYYIAQQLTSYKTTLTPKDIPKPLIELKRAQLKLRKLCLKSTTSTN